jgi:hypothetical protein
MGSGGGKMKEQSLQPQARKVFPIFHTSFLAIRDNFTLFLRLPWDSPSIDDRCLLSRIMAVFRDPEQLRELETLRREYIIAMSETHDPAEKSRLSRMVEELNICIERLRREGDG